MEDIRSRKDLFGKPLLITRRATADNPVSVAQGEAEEISPAVLIRDAPVIFIEGSAGIPQIPKEKCLYFACFDGRAGDYRS